MEPQSESGKVIIIVMMGGKHHKLRNIEKEREQVMVIFIKPGNHCYSKGNSLVLPLWASRPSIQPSTHSFNIYWVIPTPTQPPSSMPPVTKDFAWRMHLSWQRECRHLKVSFCSISTVLKNIQLCCCFELISQGILKRGGKKAFSFTCHSINI